MKITRESINLYDEGGNHLVGPVDLKIYWSWILYPQVYDVQGRYLECPSVGIDGLLNPAIPYQSQLHWIKCLWSKNKYIERWLKPHIAQLQHYKEFGYFPINVVTDSAAQMDVINDA